MKKILFSLLLILSVAGIASAQAYEGTIEFEKKKQKAVIINYSFPSEAVENAVIKKMQELGYKVKEEKGFLNKDKGFLVFKNAYVTDITPDRMDYIIKVERKSRKANDESVLYLVMNKDGVNAFETLSAFDVGRAKTFVSDMLPEIEAANLELQIKAQEETVAKAEKKLKNLRDDQVNLEKKLADNQSDQESTQRDIEAQKQALGTLIGRRKVN